MAKADAKWVAGCMSGTSLDGVDVAAILTDGEDVFEFGKTDYRAFSEKDRAVLRGALGAWHDDPRTKDAAQVVQAAHQEVLQGFKDVALIGFHGQTLAHDPGGKGTHQCGDGAVLAGQLQVPVAWDFRTNDVALGGQGAPLAPIYHAALVRWAKAQGPVAILNLGGVGNVTYVDPALPPEEGLLAFDTGPANAPIDDLMYQRRGQRFDVDGALAASGVANQKIIASLTQHSFFSKMPPKSLDRNAFHDALTAVADLEDGDAAATLAALVVETVRMGALHFPQMPQAIWVTGGGRRNPVIMQGLRDALPFDVIAVDDVGIDGDMLEAQAFAYLAARIQKGLPTSFPKTTGVPVCVGGGTISRP